MADDLLSKTPPEALPEGAATVPAPKGGPKGVPKGVEVIDRALLTMPLSPGVYRMLDREGEPNTGASPSAYTRETLETI